MRGILYVSKFFSTAFPSSKCVSCVTAAPSAITILPSICALIISGFTYQPQSSGCHHLPALAVATLLHLFLYPCLLHGMGIVFRKPFDRGYFLAGGKCNRDRTGTYRRPVKVDSTGTTLRNATAILCAGKVGMVAYCLKARAFWGQPLPCNFCR